MPSVLCCCDEPAPPPPCVPVTNADLTILPVPPGPYPAPQLLGVVVALGPTPPFTYQWFQAPAILLPGETNPTYLANPPVQSDFYVVVTNACGVGQTPAVSVEPVCVPATVTVDPPQPPPPPVPPPFVTPLPNPTLLTALVAGTAPFTYQWYEAPNLPGDVPGPFALIPFATLPTYLAAPTFKTWYRCEVTNACSVVISDERLVDEAPA